jgi:hypothetical protein
MHSNWRFSADSSVALASICRDSGNFHMTFMTSVPGTQDQRYRSYKILLAASLPWVDFGHYNGFDDFDDLEMT